MKNLTVKDRVLRTLMSNAGNFCSGQDLASELNVSRTAVWKAIEQLRNEGYAIDASTNRGYTLKVNADALSSSAILASLNDEAADFFRVECATRVTSTNKLLRTRGVDNEPEGLVLAAEEQTEGRGRQGRSFFSPKNTGLYFSILLRPKISAQDAVLITAAAASAAAKACEKVCSNLKEGDLQIKWVNDLYLNGLKVAGILTEGMISMEAGGLEFAVLGIGFNLYTPEGGWPQEIQGIAGSLVSESAETSTQHGLRSMITAEFLNEFLPLYKHLTERTFLRDYADRQLVVGHDVEVMQGEPPYRTAKAIGVDRDCHLLVHYPEDPEDRLHALNSGEVRIKPIKNS